MLLLPYISSGGRSRTAPIHMSAFAPYRMNLYLFNCIVHSIPASISSLRRRRRCSIIQHVPCSSPGSFIQSIPYCDFHSLHRQRTDVWYCPAANSNCLRLPSFLANVNSSSCSLYVVVRPSVCLSSVCNVRAPYSGDWNFRNFFFTIWYGGHLLTSR